MEKLSLDQQIDNLSNQADKLKSEIMATGRGITSPIKRERMARRADLLTEITILKEKKEAMKETQATTKIHDLWKNTKRIIVVEINGARVTPDEENNIILKFSCGKHSKKIHISEITTYGRSPIPQQRVLSQWTSFLESNAVLKTGFNCKQCRAVKTKRFQKFRTHSQSDVQGTCQLSLQVI